MLTMLCTRIQDTFIGVCALKVLAMAALCYKAYRPFQKIIVNNRLLQSARDYVSADAPAPSVKLSMCAAVADTEDSVRT
jgi:hypothetical protein